MFVTQKEIEARLASDENLLNVLLTDFVVSSPSDCDEVNENTPSLSDTIEEDEADKLEFLNDSDGTASANFTSKYSGDVDVQLQRIVEEAEQESATRDDDRRVGRPKDAINRSTEQRADIALMGEVLGVGLAADLLGVSTASPSLHSRGVVSHGEEIDFELDKVVKRKLHKIRNKSADALIKVLDHADSNQFYDKLNNAKDAMFVANQLANVVSKVQPQEAEQKPTAQFVIIQPTVRSVEQYEVINV
jgi:hypothetical protein